MSKTNLLKGSLLSICAGLIIGALVNAALPKRINEYHGTRSQSTESITIDAKDYFLRYEFLPTQKNNTPCDIWVYQVEKGSKASYGEPILRTISTDEISGHINLKLQGEQFFEITSQDCEWTLELYDRN